MTKSVCVLVFALATLTFCLGEDGNMESFSFVDEVNAEDSRDINSRMINTTTTAMSTSSSTMNVTTSVNGNTTSSMSSIKTPEPNMTTPDFSSSTDVTSVTESYGTETTTEESTTSHPTETTKPPCGQRWQTCQRHEDCCSLWCKTWISRCF